ncbi:MAG: RCC1 domain-containing protein [Ilumatobacteraceae bacterium]
MRFVSAGDAHTCVVLDDYGVRCFGLGSEGRLGSGATASIGDSTARSVASSAAIGLGLRRTARAIAAGSAHTCALLDDWSVKCWGYNADGQLGVGAIDSRGDLASEMDDALTAVDFGSGRTATQVAVGAHHSCALLDNYDVKCWGRNSDGQLGYGDTANRGDQSGEMGTSLQAVQFPTGRSARTVAAGANHTCAILDNSSVICWGLNDYGQLGQNSTTSIGDTSTTKVEDTTPIDLGVGRTALALAAGDSHTCAILDNSSVKCWGAGGNGRLGVNDTADVGDGNGSTVAAVSAVDLGSGRTARAISAGAAHTCALLDDSTVKCWGNGADGRLGYENANDIGDDAGEVGNSLQAVSLGTGRTAVAISAGAQHTCAVLDDASLKCWGKGTNGRRGSDSTTSAGSTAGTMGDSLAIVAFSTGRTVSVVESTTTTTTSTTTTTVAPTTSTSSTTAAPTTTTAPATTAAPTTTAAPATTAAPSGGGESAPPVVVASPISTTSSSTSTTIQPTTTTSVVPTSTTTPVVERVRSLGVLILPPFRTGSFELNTAQKNRLGRYSVRLRAGDRVTCTAYQAGSPTFVSQLSLRRAKSVCAYLGRQVPGLTVRAVTAAADVSAQVQRQDLAGLSPSALLRRVVVQATPGAANTR